MRVLVTGATGFVGSHIVEQLRSRRDLVRATVRPSSNTVLLKKLGVELAECSLETGEGLGAALDGVDAVIHCAGGGQVVHYDDFHRQNVVTTEVLLNAIVANKTPITRFVHASSITAAPGDLSGECDSIDDDRFEPRSLYGKAKRQAERVVLSFAEKLTVTLIRLPALYGPRDTRWLTAFRAVKWGVVPVIGQSKLSLLYATDAASSMIVPLRAEHRSGRIYCPTDGCAKTHEELGKTIAAALKIRPWVVRVPPSVLRGAASVNEYLGKRLGTRVFLTHDKVGDMLSDCWQSDSTLMQRELGWAAEVDFSEGTRQTAAWFRSEGLL